MRLQIDLQNSYADRQLCRSIDAQVPGARCTARTHTDATGRKRPRRLTTSAKPTVHTRHAHGSVCPVLSGVEATVHTHTHLSSAYDARTTDDRHPARRAHRIHTSRTHTQCTQHAHTYLAHARQRTRTQFREPRRIRTHIHSLGASAAHAVHTARAHSFAPAAYARA